jgi:hypothetical protein
MTNDIQPVVIEFTSSDSQRGDAKHYFIGTSVENILADTKGGKEFGSEHYSSHRQISLEEAKKLSLEFYQAGFDRVQQNGCKSYFLGQEGERPVFDDCTPEELYLLASREDLDRKLSDEGIRFHASRLNDEYNQEVAHTQSRIV